MVEGEAFLLHREDGFTYEVLFSWEIRGNYATKSTLAECVKGFAWDAFN